LKDIVNPHVREALERLERAISRVDSVAQAKGPSEEISRLKDAFEQLTRDHAALKTSASRVADRLDAVIGQVRAGLDE
jgi:predicted RND superfamily exporter protein